MRRVGLLPALAPSPPRAWRPRFVVACGQMETGRDLARNRRVILRQIEEAARKHRAKLVVLPETALSGYAPFHWPEGCGAMDFHYLRESEEAVRAAARRFRIGVVVGTTGRSGAKFFNTALVFGPDGRRVGRYDKLHLTGAATQTLDTACFAPGATKHLKPLTLAGLRVGVQICLDMRFPEPFRMLAQAGARLIAHPTAAFGRENLWKRPAVEANLSSRASENACWLASANAAGPFQFITSRIIDPDGLVVTAAQDDCEEVISAAIDPDWMGRGNFLAARREDAYRLRLKT